MPAWLWNEVADDGSAWSANPEPDCHLAVWRGKRGWDWHRSGRIIVQNWDQSSADVAKMQAERHYQTYVEHGLKRRG